MSQSLTQTVRGTIIDVDSEMPMIGVTIMIVGLQPIKGTTTNQDGAFKINEVPTGRVTLELSYLGYETRVVHNIVVNSGKEVVLDLSLQESPLFMNEVVITSEVKNGDALNDMAIASAQAISPEQTERYAGGFNDPSRIVSAYAGVATSNDSDNDIIVRGNSPKYFQYRLEGVEITNPTHFADQNSVRGGVSALNNNLLTTSDFYTGAFTADYGNALSGIYDLKLRNGNNEQFEATFGFGLLGTDLTLEGPLNKKGASYLVNYRYSTIGLVSDLGLVDLEGDLTFQDAAFKLRVPTKKAGTFSFFGLRGASSFDFEDIKADFFSTPGDELSDDALREDYNKNANLLNLGLNHTIPLSESSFLKTSISFSGTGIKEEIYETSAVEMYDSESKYLGDSIISSNLDYKSDLKNLTYRVSTSYSNKINSKNKFKIGSLFTINRLKHDQSWLQEQNNQRFVAVDLDVSFSSLRNYITWKHRLSDKVTIVGGIHNTNVLFNNKHTLEFRLSANWDINAKNSLYLGSGNHSTMESPHNYFAQVETADGLITEPNHDLDLLKADHYVIGYKNRLSKNLTLKLEAYYQDLYNLPVENDPKSNYSTINEGVDFRYVELTNEGKGVNYGIEATLERSFKNDYYFLVNGTIYNSKYTALDGIERNTAFNGRYIFNILAGKEWTNIGKKKNKSFSLNAKLFFGGGKHIVPLLRDNAGNVAISQDERVFYDYDNAFDTKLDDIYTVIISASYKINKPKATHEIFLNLDNITNTKGRLSEYYDPSEPSSTGYVSQFGIFPNLMYRVYF